MARTRRVGTRQAISPTTSTMMPARPSADKREPAADVDPPRIVAKLEDEAGGKRQTNQRTDPDLYQRASQDGGD